MNNMKRIIFISAFLIIGAFAFAGDQEDYLWGANGENSSLWLVFDFSSNEQFYYNFGNGKYDSMYYKGSYFNLGPEDDSWVRTRLDFGYYISHGKLWIQMKKLRKFDKNKNVLAEQMLGDKVTAMEYGGIIKDETITTLTLGEDLLVLVK